MRNVEENKYWKLLKYTHEKNYTITTFINIAIYVKNLWEGNIYLESTQLG